MPPPFRLELLGDPAFSGPDGPVRGRAAHKRRVALLAILAVARGRPVGRERIIGLLWPELTTEAARHNLSVHHHLSFLPPGNAQPRRAGPGLRR